MIDTVVMTGEQTRHVEEVAETWHAFGPILQSKRQLVGGLQWKKVAGNEYLYRYQPDPITKQKRSTSVGRRNPETEALYSAFVAGRDSLALQVAQIEPILESQTRVSKALRLNRYPNEAARVATTLWEDGLVEHMLALGENAVAAYEVEYGKLVDVRSAPKKREAPYPQEQRAEIAFLIPHDEEFLGAMIASLRRIDRSYQASFTTVKGERGPEIRFFTREMISEEALLSGRSDDAEALESLLDQPAVSNVAISKSGRPVPIYAVNPVGFAAYELWTHQHHGLASTITSLALDRDTGDYDIQDYFNIAQGEDIDHASHQRMRP